MQVRGGGAGWHGHAAELPPTPAAPRTRTAPAPRRLLPGQAPLAALLDQPTLASKVSRLGHLSLW